MTLRSLPALLTATLAVALTIPALSAQTAPGPFARIAVLRPHDGQTTEFEAGYVRHLAWHRQAGEPWVWYGWNITFGDRQRWFVYATFGRSAADLDNAVAPAEDERDNVLNVAPHVEYLGNALYEYLPDLSRGTGQPTPAARLELTTVEVVPGSEKSFEAALGASQATLQDETLWYRRIAGGAMPCYVRLRPRLGLRAILGNHQQQALPDSVLPAIAHETVEILTLRPAMSLGLESAAGKQ